MKGRTNPMTVSRGEAGSGKLKMESAISMPLLEVKTYPSEELKRQMEWMSRVSWYSVNTECLCES